MPKSPAGTSAGSDLGVRLPPRTPQRPQAPEGGPVLETPPRRACRTPPSGRLVWRRPRGQAVSRAGQRSPSAWAQDAGGAGSTVVVASSDPGSGREWTDRARRPSSSASTTTWELYGAVGRPAPAVPGGSSVELVEARRSPAPVGEVRTARCRAARYRHGVVRQPGLRRGRSCCSGRACRRRLRERGADERESRRVPCRSPPRASPAVAGPSSQSGRRRRQVGRQARRRAAAGGHGAQRRARATWACAAEARKSPRPPPPRWSTVTPSCAAARSAF